MTPSDIYSIQNRPRILLHGRGEWRGWWLARHENMALDSWKWTGMSSTGGWGLSQSSKSSMDQFALKPMGKKHWKAIIPRKRDREIQLSCSSVSWLKWWRPCRKWNHTWPILAIWSLVWLCTYDWKPHPRFLAFQSEWSRTLKLKAIAMNLEPGLLWNDPAGPEHVECRHQSLPKFLFLAHLTMMGTCKARHFLISPAFV